MSVFQMYHMMYGYRSFWESSASPSCSSSTSHTHIAWQITYYMGTYVRGRD